MQNLRKIKKRKKNATVLTHEQSAVKNLCQISKAQPQEQQPTEADLFLLHASTQNEGELTIRNRRLRKKSLSPEPKRMRIETAPTAFSEYLPMTSIRIELSQQRRTSDRNKLRSSWHINRKRSSHESAIEVIRPGLRIFSNPLINPTVAVTPSKRQRFKSVQVEKWLKESQTCPSFRTRLKQGVNRQEVSGFRVSRVKLNSKYGELRGITFLS